jgi:hypothetical protein
VRDSRNTFTDVFEQAIFPQANFFKVTSADLTYKFCKSFADFCTVGLEIPLQKRIPLDTDMHE